MTESNESKEEVGDGESYDRRVKIAGGGKR